MNKSLGWLTVIFSLQSVVFVIMIFVDFTNFLSYLFSAITSFALVSAMIKIGELSESVEALETRMYFTNTNKKTYANTHINKGTTNNKRFVPSEKSKTQYLKTKTRDDFVTEEEWEEYVRYNKI